MTPSRRLLLLGLAAAAGAAMMLEPRRHDIWGGDTPAPGAAPGSPPLRPAIYAPKRGQTWLDTSGGGNGGVGVLKVYDGTAWRTMATSQTVTAGSMEITVHGAGGGGRGPR